MATYIIEDQERTTLGLLVQKRYAILLESVGTTMHGELIISDDQGCFTVLTGDNSGKTYNISQHELVGVQEVKKRTKIKLTI